MPINKLQSLINYEKRTINISAEIHSDGPLGLFPPGAVFKVEQGAVSIGAAGELLFGVELSWVIPAHAVKPVAKEAAAPEPESEPEEKPKKGRKETIQ